VCYDAARAALNAVREPASSRFVADLNQSGNSVKQRFRAGASFGRWLNRPRRVLLALSAVWVVAVFDLGFTLAEWGTMDFVEINPLAARILGGPEQTVMAFKFGLLGLGTIILLALRRHFIAELGCWFLFVSKVYLAVRWYVYYDCLLSGYVNPMIRASG